MKRLLVAPPLLLLFAGCPKPDPVPSPTPPPPHGYDCASPPALSGFVEAENPVGDRYIVVMKQRGAVSAAAIGTFAARHPSLREVKVMRSVGGFEAAADTESAARRVAEDPQVQYVTPVQRMSIPRPASGVTAPPAVSYPKGRHPAAATRVWGLDAIDDRAGLDGDYSPDATGGGVHAYVIDTGLDAAHAEFVGRVGECHTEVTFGGCSDAHGHGTHVAGTVGGRTFGVAAEVTLHAVRVLDAQGSGTDAQVIRGIEWATEHALDHGWPAVANMSLGGSASPALDQAVCNSIASGVVHVVAAGNDGSDACDDSPARVHQALTLGASDRSDSAAGFSNRGPCLDLYAPGVDVESARAGGGSVTFSGTSMASPHAAGVAALVLQRHSGTDPAGVLSRIVAAATSGRLRGVPVATPSLFVYALEPTP